MATAAIRDLYESIRPVHTPKTGFVGTIRRQIVPRMRLPRLGTLLQGAALLIAVAAMFGIGPDSAVAQESVLYNFGNTSTDGQGPESALIFDSKGNLYGATSGGGLHSYGTVFELSPGAGGVWTETILYNFGVTTSDAAAPQSVVFDSKGNLYGTAGGGQFGYGSVFELSPQAGGSWTEQVIHSFNLGEADGYDPAGNPAVDSAGNVYVATAPEVPRIPAPSSRYRPSPAARGRKRSWSASAQRLASAGRLQAWSSTAKATSMGPPIAGAAITEAPYSSCHLEREASGPRPCCIISP